MRRLGIGRSCNGRDIACGVSSLAFLSTGVRARNLSDRSCHRLASFSPCLRFLLVAESGETRTPFSAIGVLATRDSNVNRRRVRGFRHSTCDEHRAAMLRWRARQGRGTRGSSTIVCAGGLCACARWEWYATTSGVDVCVVMAVDVLARAVVCAFVLSRFGGGLCDRVWPNACT